MYPIVLALICIGIMCCKMFTGNLLISNCNFIVAIDITAGIIRAVIAGLISAISIIYIAIAGNLFINLFGALVLCIISSSNDASSHAAVITISFIHTRGLINPYAYLWKLKIHFHSSITIYH
jgi:hypothetical protein